MGSKLQVLKKGTLWKMSQSSGSRKFEEIGRKVLVTPYSDGRVETPICGEKSGVSRYKTVISRQIKRF